jgi:hypothetical protein
MNRRDFLRRSALITAGVVAADQLELVERLGWTRKLFPGWRPADRFGYYDMPRATIPPDGDVMIVSVIDQSGRVWGSAPVIDGVAEVRTYGGLPPGHLRWVVSASGFSA